MSSFVLLSNRFQKHKEGEYTLYFRGDIFSFNQLSFQGPGDPQGLQTLFTALKDDPRGSWALVQGNFSAVWQTPEAVCFYRSPFSPYSLFFSRNGISDDLRNFYQMSHNFSSEYFRKFVLDMPSLQFNSELTPFDGVSRLLPHSVVRLTKDEKPEIKLLPWERYVLSESNQDPLKSAETLRDSLKSILTWHLSKGLKTHVELSGGLDSSFVASFLADLSPQPIQAHMYAFRQNPSHAFSEDCAREVASKKNIQLEVIDSGTLIQTDLSSPAPYQNEPIDFFWQGALFGRVCQKLLRENSLLFTGFGADQILMRNQRIVTGIFKKNGFWAGIPWVRAIAESLNRPSLNFFYQYLLSSLPENFLLSLLHSTRNWRINPFKLDELMPHFLQNESVSWIKGQEDLLSLQEEGQVLEQRFFEPFYPHAQMNYLVAPQYVLGPYLEEVGIEYIHPFCDPRMIDLVFRQLPFSQIHDFRNPYKHLLRLAMEGIVPEKVRTRKKDEFSFDGYFFALLKNNQDFLRSLLDTVVQEHGDWIDPSSAHQSFELLFFGGSSNSEIKLNRLLAYAYWKRNFLSNSSKTDTP